jgi:pyridine nucleotide-disulfide oxidoreductase family protein
MARKSIVLIGGGHAHIEVVRRSASVFGDQDTDITLISPEQHAVYSGMIPGVIAGHYQASESMIDLPHLCERYGVQWMQGRFRSIDLSKQSILLSDGGEAHYDAVSLDIGSIPSCSSISGNANIMPVKPALQFLQQWQSVVDGIIQDTPQTVTIIGGGVAGIEIILAMHYRIQKLVGEAAIKRWNFRLISSTELLRGHNQKVRQSILNALVTSAVQVIQGRSVTQILENQILLDDGSLHASDHTVLATQAKAYPFLKDSNLPLSASGFVPVNNALQVPNAAGVFAVGDVAEFPQPLAKAGVYPVRQGPILAYNLHVYVHGHELKPFTAQSTFLSLIALGERSAVASKGRFYSRGALVWWWKNWVDKTFVGKYSK